MRLLEKLEKKGETQKTNKKNPSGNFKSKLQFQGMNPINISFKIGFFLLFFFSKSAKIQRKSPKTSQGTAGKGIFWEWIEPQAVWLCVSSAN